MDRNFRQLLSRQWEQKKFLCIGLDPDIEKIPEVIRQWGTRETIVAFNRAIIDATKDVAGSYKPNTAFYEAHGDEGWDALRETIQYIHEHASEVPVILDAKRADIGNTNEYYARSAFDHLHADAITVNPFPGRDGLKPFLDRKEKGILVWCKASNPGSGEFQDLSTDGNPLWHIIAQHVAKDWNSNGNCGLVVGATYPEELKAVRDIAPDLPILIPGIGAQGGDLEKSVVSGKDAADQGFIIAAGRAILYASSGADFAVAAGKKARETHEAIQKAL